jgi:hypothetical protein
VEADQPVSVVGVEFVPDGSADTVLAVDLIDEGSRPGLKQDSPIGIEYESRSPRTAYIQGATRTFVGRNIRGIAGDAVLCLLVIAGMFAASQFLGRAYNRLLTRRK